MKVIDWYWDENDLIVHLENEEIHRLKNAYISHFTFGEIESKVTEEITLVGNNKVWKKT